MKPWQFVALLAFTAFWIMVDVSVVDVPARVRIKVADALQCFRAGYVVEMDMHTGKQICTTRGGEEVEQPGWK